MENEKQTRPDEPTSGTEKPRLRRRKVTPFPVDALLIAFIVLLLIVIVPNFYGERHGSRETELKSYLHAIQLAVERYATDNNGEYPPYLIGGANEYAVMVKIEDRREIYTRAKNCPFPSQLVDPLVREGYMPSYPRNPFARNGRLHSFQMEHNDPLRNGTEEGKLHGTRFGPSCRLMGNVMADKRYATFTLPGATEPTRTYAEIEYPCADFWPKGAHEPQPFLPGMFFYRSQSRTAQVSKEGGGWEVREMTDSYILGAYGGLRTKGKDVIGPDATGLNAFSPFGGGAGDESVYGNPNGIRDGIILVLTPGEDVPVTQESDL